MREERMNKSSWDSVDILTEENRILKHNVKELQGQLQNAYKRIAELQPNNNKQMELDI
tara:strand:- start:298 stop:471 length:174 start_codon:yes stop_codon:yes gene_type:complete